MYTGLDVDPQNADPPRRKEKYYYQPRNNTQGLATSGRGSQALFKRGLKTQYWFGSNPGFPHRTLARVWRLRARISVPGLFVFMHLRFAQVISQIFEIARCAEHFSCWAARKGRATEGRSARNILSFPGVFIRGAVPRSFYTRATATPLRPHRDHRSWCYQDAR